MNRAIAFAHHFCFVVEKYILTFVQNWCLRINLSIQWCFTCQSVFGKLQINFMKHLSNLKQNPDLDRIFRLLTWNKVLPANFSGPEQIIQSRNSAFCLVTPWFGHLKKIWRCFFINHYELPGNGSKILWNDNLITLNRGLSWGIMKNKKRTLISFRIINKF